MKISLKTEQDSELLALKIVQYFQSPLIVTFSGEIGTGKTTFIRFMMKGLGVKTSVKSPTFSLVESYSSQEISQIHHFDLYRIHDEDELEYIGFRDYLNPNAVCFVEWPEKASQSLAQADLNFRFELEGSGRLLTIQTLSFVGQKILLCFSGKS